MHYKTSHGDRRDCYLPLWRLCFLVLWNFRSDRDIQCLFCLDSNQKVRNLPKKIANIAPPYLHILLGITLKHPNLIQKEVQNRDEIIAKQKHSNYRRNWLKAEEKKKQIVLSKGTLYWMMRAEEECGEKRQRGVKKKLKRQK